jgi:hypothetical protein
MMTKLNILILAAALALIAFGGVAMAGASGGPI